VTDPSPTGPDTEIVPTDEPYRRRIELRPSEGSVGAAMEDYVHHFALRLDHDGTVITAVDVVPQRVPWRTCPGGAAGLHRLVGVPLAEVADLDRWMGGRAQQCVHTVDLAVLAAATALRGTDRTYEVWLEGAGRAEMSATLVRDGEEWATWRTAGTAVLDEGRFAGLTLDRTGFSSWIDAHLGPDDREAAFVMRRGLVIGISRAVVHDAWVRPDDARPADGSCFTYAPPHVHEAEISMRPRPTERDGRGTPIPPTDRGGVPPVDPAA
jgi:hypothetical protein